MTKLTDMTKSIPDPKNFEIERTELIYGWEHPWTIVEVRYPDVEHLGGFKVLVFAGDVSSWLLTTNFIDPHFGWEDTAPVARFNPSKDGWEHALKFCLNNT